MTSVRPNEDMRTPQYAVPVDPWTGWPLKPVVLARIAKLKEATQAYRRELHELDGTTEGSRPGDRRMANAFAKLEEAEMWAAAALLDHYKT